MSMDMLNAVTASQPSISQFMFLGLNSWAAADPASLNLTGSGDTSEDLGQVVTGDFYDANTFVGLSGPNSATTNAFAFMIKISEGTFTTFDLPSDFPFLSSFSGVTVGNAVYNDSNVIYAYACSETVGVVLNLSQICGLTSGGTTMYSPTMTDSTSGNGPLYAGNYYNSSFPVYKGQMIVLGGEIYIANGNYNYLNYVASNQFYSGFGSYPLLGMLGDYIVSAYSNSNGIEIYLYNISENSSTTYNGSFSLSGNDNGEGALFLYGLTILGVQWANSYDSGAQNQAQSANLAVLSNIVSSPVFPLELIGSSETSYNPGFYCMDQSTGVYYQNNGGVSTFANLSPMQF